MNWFSRACLPAFATVLFAAGTLGAEHPLPPALVPLQQKIASAPAAQRSALLTELADRLEAVDPLRGIALAREAVACATSPHDKLAAEAVLATLLRYPPDFATAQELARAGIERAAALGEDRLRTQFCCALARISWNLSDNAAALKLYHEAIRLGEQLDDARILTDAHLGTVLAWTGFDEFGLAQGHIELARKYAEQSGDTKCLISFYRVLGGLRMFTNDPVGARAAQERSRDLSRSVGEDRSYADAVSNIATFEANAGHLETALAMVAESVAIYDRLDLKRYRANAYCGMAHLLAQLGRFTEALDYAGRALALVRDNGADSIIASCYREFVFVHQAAGHTAEAAEYQKKLDEKTAQSTNDRTRRQAALLKAQFEIERDGRLELARHDQALKAEQLRQARLQRYGLVALAALGVVAAAAVISRQRLKLAAERRVLEETRAARQTAEEASRLKTRLLGIASHDLKSPLSALIGCAKEIEQRPHDTALAAEFSALMRQEGEQMLTLVRDLLDLSAIESGQLKLACAPSDLVEIANRRVEAHRLAAVAKQQTLAVVCPDHAPVIVDADAARLAQVFDNLISNAVKFTPRGGAIEVRVETAGDRAMVRVRDGGPGLVPEDFARLFQPFQTLSAQPTGGESSSGLGLFIAREIVSRHGGTLGVDSAPGEGATFVFELPMGPAEPGRKSEIRSAKSETLSRSATA